MTRRTLTLHFIVLFGLAIAASAQVASLSSTKLLHDTFDTVWKTVNNSYYDPKFGGVDWGEIRKKYEPQIEGVRSDAEFRDLLTRMLREIKTSHLRIIDLGTVNQSLIGTELSPGVVVRDLNKQVVVTRVVDGSPAAAAGVRPGFVITAVDGVPVTGAGAAEWMLGTKPTSHRVKFLDEADAPREIELAYKLPSENRLVSNSIQEITMASLLETKTLDGDIGYIHFTTFIPKLEGRLRDFFDSIRNATGIIIDLRGNGGGYNDTGVSLASMIVDKDTIISRTQTRKGSHEYKARPAKNPYLGKVVILIDEDSSSESEEVAAGLQAVGRVYVIGTRTHGSDMDADVKRLPIKSMALMYPVGLPRTSKGVPIEGIGVTPDLEVPLTRAELLQGRDAHLDAAIRHIRSGSAGQ